MTKVTNNCGSDYGFNFGGELFTLLKGVNNVSESNFAELLKQPMFKLIYEKGKFDVEVEKKVSAPKVETKK
jgi:hypothetical protein